MNPIDVIIAVLTSLISTILLKLLFEFIESNPDSVEIIFYPAAVIIVFCLGLAYLFKK